MLFIRSVAFAAFFALAPSPTLAQTAPADANSDVVVVTGHNVDEAIQAFVGNVSSEAGTEDQLARWDQRICPGVTGMRRDQAQAVVDHIAARALEIGLEVGAPGCQANVFVMVSADAQQLANTVWERYGGVVDRPDNAGVATRGRVALGEFVHEARPVRWWHMARGRTGDGTEANPASTAPLHGDSLSAAARQNGGASRVVRTVHQRFVRAVIIVDAPSVADVSVGSLADYLAMVALAQLDPDADTAAYSTILNLFSPAAGGVRPISMTNWDRAYLQGLYSAPVNRAQSTQERAIERRMRQEVAISR